MVRSDLWAVLNSEDPANTEGRSPHTHHITLEDAEVTTLTNGLRVTGLASVTGNGNPAFTSPLQINITGGTAVTYSNVAVKAGPWALIDEWLRDHRHPSRRSGG